MLTDAEKQQAEELANQFMRDYHNVGWDAGCSLIRVHVTALELSNAELRKENKQLKEMAERLLNELSRLAESKTIDEGQLRFAKEKAAADGIPEIHKVHIHAGEQYGGDR